MAPGDRRCPSPFGQRGGRLDPPSPFFGVWRGCGAVLLCFIICPCRAKSGEVEEVLLRAHKQEGEGSDAG